MRLADLACRCCRKTYNIPEGCAICESAKRNLVAPDPTQEGSELLSTARQALRLTQLNLDRLERAMREGSLGAKRGEYIVDLAEESTKINRGLAVLMEATRKLEEREQKRVQAAGFEEQIDIWLQWIESLPREHQGRILDAVVRLLEPEPTPAQLVASTDVPE